MASADDRRQVEELMVRWRHNVLGREWERLARRMGRTAVAARISSPSNSASAAKDAEHAAAAAVVVSICALVASEQAYAAGKERGFAAGKERGFAAGRHFLATSTAVPDEDTALSGRPACTTSPKRPDAPRRRRSDRWPPRRAASSATCAHRGCGRSPRVRPRASSWPSPPPGSSTRCCSGSPPLDPVVLGGAARGELGLADAKPA
ncbi:MAG: hypothetical protein OXI73_01305 [Rhodospirillales bacterium]|nr:hypothetical protein [Rhodospirillales bacterium]